MAAVHFTCSKEESSRKHKLEPEPDTQRREVHFGDVEQQALVMMMTCVPEEKELYKSQMTSSHEPEP